MNMISTGAFQTEMDASNKQPTLAEKFAAVWEKKNAKAARANCCLYSGTAVSIKWRNLTLGAVLTSNTTNATMTLLRPTKHLIQDGCSNNVETTAYY